MREKKKETWYTAAMILVFTILIVSCQSADQPTSSMSITNTHVEFPTSTMSAFTLTPLSPTPTQTTIPAQQTLVAEQANSFSIQQLFYSAADCTAAGVPDSACTGVSTNSEWVPVIREFGGIPMALVPAGCYTMGITDEQVSQYFPMMDHQGIYADEQPAHMQCFQEPFWIDVYEVTNGFYGSYGFGQGNDQPRETITWFEANAYCSNRGARLPTEAEWEYAARGPDNLVYPWGNTFDGTRLNYCDFNCPNPGADRNFNDGYNDTAPVGSYPDGASWVGALDMAGNVWEWVSTILQPYPYLPDDGREVGSEPDSTGLRMVRGGGRLDLNYMTRSSNRNERLVHQHDSRFGVRCARAFDPETDGEISDQARPELVFTPQINAVLGDTWTRPRDGAVLVFVPGGTFQMGANEVQAAGSSGNEFPEHAVQVDSFWIDSNHVDNKQFAEFLYWEGNRLEGGVPWLALNCESCRILPRSDYFVSVFGFEDHPVTGVSWYGAQAYCSWVGGRLLTEAEWEYAASGPDNRIYPWGNEFDCTMGNFHDWSAEDGSTFSGVRGCDGFDFTSPVNAYPEGASWVGAQDMAGNVWDWVADWGVSPYPSVLQVNPTGPESGTDKIVRGGSWDSYDWGVRTTTREAHPPILQSPFIGFRCAYPAAP
jgi:formylglycine-generating enzyme required for sulfatase activity